MEGQGRRGGRQIRGGRGGRGNRGDGAGVLQDAAAADNTIDLDNEEDVDENRVFENILNEVSASKLKLMKSMTTNVNKFLVLSPMNGKTDINDLIDGEFTEDFFGRYGSYLHQTVGFGTAMPYLSGLKLFIL